MIANIPADVLAKLEQHPNHAEGKPAEFPCGNLDGENHGAYYLYNHGDFTTIITVPPTEEYPGAVLLAKHARGLLFFTGAEIKVEVVATNEEGATKIYELKFPTPEHCFHAVKASTFEDVPAFMNIYNAASPKEAKQCGRKVKGFDEGEWKKRCITVATIITEERLKQNSDSRDFVSTTLRNHAIKHKIPFPDNVFVFESSTDTNYGTGLTPADTVDKLVGMVPKMTTLLETLKSIDKDADFVYKRHLRPENYPLTNFFPGQNWMGVSITRAIKEYCAHVLRPDADSDGRGSPKKAKTSDSELDPADHGSVATGVARSLSQD
jgi:predicted NAD-dependent protein-ADP-ribosyltransferase YbiA (DUF1768 family)